MGLSKSLPGMSSRRRKLQALQKKRRGTRRGHKAMAKAEAKEADEVAEDLAEGAAQKRFDKAYKKLESRPLYDKIYLGPMGADVDKRVASGNLSYPSKGTAARDKRVYSNKRGEK